MSSRGRAAALDSHSVEASAAQTKDRITAVQVVILGIFQAAGSLTDDQLIALYEQRAENYSGVPRATPQSIRTRRNELRVRGLLRATDRDGLSRYGNPCTVYEAVQSARA